MAKHNEMVANNSWYAYGVNQVLRCPVPDCGHLAGIITKAHCRIAHDMDREEVKKKYGMPTKVLVDWRK